MSPPPPPPYCLCEERGERPLPLPLAPQVPWEPPGEAVRGWGLAQDGQLGAIAPCDPSRLPSGPSPSPAPPTHTPAEAPATHRGGPGPPAPRTQGGERDLGTDADVRVGSKSRESSVLGEEGCTGAGTRGQLGGGGRQRGTEA